MKSQLQCSFEPVFASGSEEDEKILQELSYFAGEIVKEHFDPIIGTAQNDYMIAKFQSADAIRAQIKEGYEYYLVKAEGETVGFFALVRDLPEREGRLYISKYYVHKRFRGNGYASRMFDFMRLQAQADGNKGLYLHVNRENESAIRVYEHLGFVKADTMQTDIGNGFIMDDFVMEWLF